MSMKEYEFAWYSAGDLMFKNEDVCHFRQVAQDLMTYCEIEDNPSLKKKGKKQLTQEFQPGDEAFIDVDAEEAAAAAGPIKTNCSTSKILTNMQTSAFNLITQVSSLMAVFKEEDWEEQAPEEKAQAYQQVGRTMGSIFVDLSGFRPTIEVN